MLRRITLTRRQREALAFAERFTSESRARVAALARAGQARTALQENLGLLGGRSGQRGRLVAINGVRLH